MNKLSKTGIFTLLLISSLTIMVGTVIAPSLTEISKHLGFADNPGWLITLPSLGVVLSAPLMGWLIDRKGAYTMICWGLIPYALFGVLGAFLHSPCLVIADRILLGAATAAIQTSGTALIADLFDGEKRMKMIAWQGMSIELGGVVFLSIGGLLGEQGWYFPFFIYLIALICFILVLASIPRLYKTNVIVEIPTSKKVSKGVITIVSSAVFAMMLFFTAFTVLPVYLTQIFHFSESETGYFMAFISLIAVAAASQMPRITKHLGNLYTVALGFFFFMLGLVLFSISSVVTLLIVGAIAMGIGFGFTVPLLNHMTVEESDNSNRGLYLGYFSIGIFGGQFMSSFINLLSSDNKKILMLAAILAMIVGFIILLIARLGKKMKYESVINNQ
jgi:MFS family permease